MIARERIRRVAVRLPSERRARNAAIAGGIGAAVEMLIFVGIVRSRGGATTDEVARPLALFAGLIGGPLALVAGFGEPRKVICNVPSKHRRP